MDMESNSYRDHLAQLVKENKVPITLVDKAVKRVLYKKFELGLFDDPFKFCNPNREQKELNNPEHARIAREVAAKSIVLLKIKIISYHYLKRLKLLLLLVPW